MLIREIDKNDLFGLLELYTQLHDNAIPKMNEDLIAIWENILSDRNHHIIVAVEDEKIVSSCVVIIVPNLTHDQRPYALVENVITAQEYRNHGLASACLDYAREISKQNNCYKIMLLTGSKKEETLNFYTKAGYNSDDKTAFIQWL